MHSLIISLKMYPNIFGKLFKQILKKLFYINFTLAGNRTKNYRLKVKIFPIHPERMKNQKAIGKRAPLTLQFKVAVQKYSHKPVRELPIQ